MLEDIVKHLLKKNKGMTENEAQKRAKKIWDDYCETNKERDKKREIEHQRRFEEALNWESNNTLFDYMDEDDQ
tara:strand:- start:297 stop:515 length:219 start_codon:yes stop_codon:yes gene_type:complete